MIQSVFIVMWRTYSDFNFPSQVGYYFSKRSQCTLPPDYFAKKAAAKAAAAAKSNTPATINHKASTAKSTGVKGAKVSKSGTIKAAKGMSKIREGTSTRKATGTKSGKGLKTTKGSKAAMGLKTDKGTKAGKVSKAVTGIRSAKGIKAAKGEKATKGIGSAKVATTSKITHRPKSTATRTAAGVLKAVTKFTPKNSGEHAVKLSIPKASGKATELKAAVKLAVSIAKILRRDLEIIPVELE